MEAGEREIANESVAMLEMELNECLCRILGYETPSFTRAILSIPSITDTKCMVEYYGGLEACSEETIVKALNQTPMKQIGYRFDLEKMKCFVAELMKNNH
ncbi:MAG: hypothetical protein ABSE63_19020 [Thermoguttaceae bacterium]